jgi:hypothetical protein
MAATKSMTLASILVTAALSIPAQAQEGRPQTRQGFWFGAGLGYGSICGEECDERTGGGSGYLKLGGTVSRKVLIGFESNGWAKEDGSITISQVNGSGVVYFYPSATGGFHLKAGIGFVRATIAFDVPGSNQVISSTETGGGGLLGLGYDARIGRNVSLVPFFNILGGKYHDGKTNFFQLGLGITVH